MAKTFNVQQALASGYTQDQINQHLATRKAQGVDITPIGLPDQPKKPRGLLDLLSVGTSIGGSLIGAPLGPVGVIGGGAIGGGIGQLLEQVLSKEKIDAGDIGGEAVSGGIGGILGAGAGKLLAKFGGEAVGNELTRGVLAKNLAKGTNIGKIDELTGVARASGITGSNAAKARGYQNLANTLKTARMGLAEGSTEEIPLGGLKRALKTSAIESGWIDQSEAKKLEFFTKKLGKGKTTTPSNLLKWFESLSKSAGPTYGTAANPNATARSARALREIGNEVLAGYLPEGEMASITKQIGQAIPLSEAYTSAARTPSRIGVGPLQASLGPLSPVVQNLGDKFARLGIGASGSPLVAQGIGQGAARLGGGGAPAETGSTASQYTTQQPIGEVGTGTGGADPEQVRQAFLALMMSNPKQASTLKAIYDFGFPAADKNAGKKQALTQSVNLLLENLGQAGGAQGSGGILESLLGRTPGVRSLGLAPKAQVFEDQRKSLIAPLARAISGEVGVLTDKDISRAEGLLPRLSDPPQVAQQKIQDLLFLIQQSGSGGTPDAGILETGIAQ